MNSFSFSQLMKARGEPVAPLSTKPGLGTDPASGESSSLPAAPAMDLPALAWTIWLSTSAQPGLPFWAASAPPDK